MDEEHQRGFFDEHLVKILLHREHIAALVDLEVGLLHALVHFCMIEKVLPVLREPLHEKVELYDGVIDDRY